MSSTDKSDEVELSVIDSYCHVGIPRFGNAEDALAIAEQSGIAHSVLVLGPGVPDYLTLFHALRLYGNRVRGIGIPFGETQDQIDESVSLQLHAGVLGLRVNPHTLLQYPTILQQLGEWRGWLYAIGAADSNEVMRTLVQWLEHYPEAHIAAPHFLKPRDLFSQGCDHHLLQTLVSHPRFHPILSRHGGIGSREPYPHADLANWVKQVITTSGWDNVLWGSEYPVYTWRNETMGMCKQWLSSLLADITEEQRDAFMSHNAQRLIFDHPVPEGEIVPIPAWVNHQFDQNRTVPLFPEGVRVPMHVYNDLHHRYVMALKRNPELLLSAFVTELFKSH
jgi:hypothetical protein